MKLRFVFLFKDKHFCHACFLPQLMASYRHSPPLEKVHEEKMN